MKLLLLTGLPEPVQSFYNHTAAAQLIAALRPGGADPPPGHNFKVFSEKIMHVKSRTIHTLRHIGLLFTAGLILFSGCDRTVITPDEVAIGFSTKIEGDDQTKATTVSGTALPASTNIGVLGVYCPSGTWDATQTPWYMYNIPMGSDGSTYKNASDTKYWPSVGAIRFFAYYPYTDQSDTDKSITLTSNLHAGFPMIGISCSHHQRDHIDMLVAQTAMTARTTTAVPLTFTHTGVRLGFTARTSVETNKAITLNEIYIKGVKNSGVYHFEDDQWYLNDTDIDTLICVDGAYPLGTSAINLTSESEYTVVLPQSLSGIDMEVHYTIENTHFIRRIDLQTTEATTPWTRGKSITYAISLSPADGSIAIVCTVTDWTSKTINIPLS